MKTYDFEEDIPLVFLIIPLVVGFIGGFLVAWAILS